MSEVEAVKTVVSSYMEAGDHAKAVILGFIMGYTTKMEEFAEALENRQTQQGVVK